MERIRGFVENMFFGLPDSPELQRAKAQLIQGLADRYEEQLAQGRSEAEAFGIVAGEFGSMDSCWRSWASHRCSPSPPRRRSHARSRTRRFPGRSTGTS